MADSKDKRAADGEPSVPSVPLPRALSGARELQRVSERPTMPPVMPSMPAITSPPVSHERAVRVDPIEAEAETSAEAEAEDEIPELLRSASARPPARVPSNRPPPNLTRIAPAKKVHGFDEEVVVNRKDPRREE